MTRLWTRRLYHLSLWLVSIAFFMPVAWIIMGSFKTRDALLSMPPRVFFVPTLEHYSDLFARQNILLYFFNSLAMSVSAVALAVAVAFLAAYAFSRFQPRGTDFMMFLLLSVRMLPGAAVIVPVFLMYNAFGWEGYAGITLFYTMFSIPFCVWILKGFADGVSQRFDEAALVCGASRIHIIFRIIMPQVVPGIIAAFIFNMIFVWNEFLFNYIIGASYTQTVPVALVTGLYQTGGVDWGFITALTSVFILPPIVAIYLFQRFLLTGMTFGTVRGEV